MRPGLRRPQRSGVDLQHDLVDAARARFTSTAQMREMAVQIRERATAS